MSGQRLTGAIHLASTIWFAGCVGYILVVALLQAGVRWWIVFSLSGHGVLIVLLLVSLLFAIFRGISSTQKVCLEHPLTSTTYYKVFYVAAPILGGLAGCVGTAGMVRMIGQFLLGVALGTLGATFLVWVIVDPVTGVIETMLHPPSRRHRTERLAQLKAERECRQQERERLLADVLEKEKADLHYWQEVLRPKAEKLAELLTKIEADPVQAEREAADIGTFAWQIGGLGCMRALREMTLVICEQRGRKAGFADYIPVWWDGIGTWQNPSTHEAASI